MKTIKNNFNDIINYTTQYFKSIKELGIDNLNCSEENLDIIEKWGEKMKKENLKSIYFKLLNCKKCKLHKTRTNIVFGKGNKNAKIMIIGEGPGKEEDIKGEPFVGRAGKLLTKILSAINFNREDVYIANIIKCRPPQNRDPETDEIKQCIPFLKKQILSINPQFICTLGTFASQTLLETKEPISKIRGKFYNYSDGIKLMPTFHPAYLLRDPNKKKEVWEDVQFLRKEYDKIFENK